jgi:hypothetical protein
VGGLLRVSGNLVEGIGNGEGFGEIVLVGTSED